MCALSEPVRGVKLPAGVHVIEKGRPGAGLLAHVLLGKYCDHLPLNRQEQIFARHGVEITRSTLCDWVKNGADLLEPIAKEIHRQILASPAIFADETPLKSQTLEKEGLQSGYLWGALGPPGVYFHYSPSRAGDVAQTLLKDYSGYVHTDAYAGYNPVFLPEECVRVGCWAHVRRKFIEVQKLAKRDVDQILQLIAQLYKIEKQVRHTTSEERKSLRQKKSIPLLSQLKELLDVLNTQTLPRHKFKEALAYALNQWTELTVYTSDGRLEMDNNSIERQIRPVAVGRKNYLFVGSQDGGRRAAVLYSIINTCKIHKVNPFDYIVDVLRKVHTHPASKIAELTPQNWK